MKRMNRFFLVLLLPAVLAACNNNNNTETTAEAEVPAETGAATASSVQMPSFALVDANGQTVDLKNFAGKKVFVNLWATWCPPCRAEMPSIQKLHETVDKDKAAFVMLSLDDDFEKAKKYIAANTPNLPVYYPQNFENLPELFNVRGIPATFIFDENGQLIKSMEGADNYDTDAYRKLLNQ